MRRFLPLFVALGALVLMLRPSRAVPEPPAPARFHFSIVGDRAGGTEPQIYGRVWREVALLRPDFVITVGDAILGNDEDKLEEQWREAKKIWARYGEFHLFHIPGNHDIWSERSREAYVRHAGFQAHYSFRHQNALFVVAETGRGDELPTEELDFIEKRLEADKTASPKFLFFHKPFWQQKFQAGDSSFRLHQLARKYQVTAVVSGHGHRFLHLERDGIRYMEVGSSGGTMRGKLVRGEGFREGCFYHHVWATVDGSRVTFAVKEIDVQYGQGPMFDAADWNEAGPQFDSSDPAISKHPETSCAVRKSWASKNDTAEAISSGRPTRRSMALAAMSSISLAASSALFPWYTMSVRINPGAMAFTEMPNGPSSRANRLVSAITAALVAA
ncbi:MAG: metallophosphoesterase [Acidobacteria bacterium]|nr:metallophosphoesterase [Acidobacteriota bacterium]